jgi:hypothetical protein
MTLLLLCAAGWALGRCFNLFALVLALVVTTFTAFLMNVDAGVWTAISVAACLQVGYVAGMASRRLNLWDGGMREQGRFRRPRG